MYFGLVVAMVSLFFLTPLSALVFFSHPLFTPFLSSPVLFIEGDVT